ALILRLLAKNPEERPDSASDVLMALESIDPSEPSRADLSRNKLQESDASGEPDHDASSVIEPNVLDSLAGNVFVGRQAEMGQLKENGIL
ncbi:MAG: hypothetical protein IH796_03075, partial [Deltaproteobacteria bacterium]|nr:hypothetical protein [Deltaproteobacteria bacterium]